jgi:hypothetical protein
MNNVTEARNWDDIEIFQDKGARIGQPKVTILEGAQILLNAGFVHTAKINDKKYAIMGYSDANKAIIFKFLDKQAKNTLKVVKRGGSASIGTRSFFNFYHLKPETIAGHYIPKHERIPQIGEVWVISLKEKLP